MKKLAPEFVALTQDACLKAFWTKNALRTFLKMHKISDELLSQLNDGETKNQFLARLFFALADPNKDKGSVILSMAESLAAMNHFPDLERWEDSPAKIRTAKEAVARLKVEVDKVQTNIEEEKRQQQRRIDAEKRRQANIAAQNTISKLTQALADMVPKQGTQEGGYAFEAWFYDLAQFFDIDSRPPYRTDGRQIDGALTIDGTTFLVEAKFTNSMIDPQDIEIFMGKVTRKADNTMGVFVSMAGYNEKAIKEASRDKTPLLLLDHTHIYGLILSNIMSLADVIRRIKRHASQTGEAYLPPNKF
jgi:hypothetical protein